MSVPHTIESIGQLEERLRQDTVPVLLDFFAPWCAPCGLLAPVLDRLAVEFDGRAEVAKIDIDAHPELAARFGITAVPTLALFRDARLLAVTQGFQSERALRQMIAGALPGTPAVANPVATEANP